MGSAAPLALLLAVLPSAAQLRFEKAIPLLGVEGRIDHLAADVKGNRVFLAALGNNTLEVLDVRTGVRITSVGGLREPQGLAFLPPLNRIAVANAIDGKCRLFDATTFKPVGEMDFSGDADNVRFDASRQAIYVGHGDGALGVADPATANIAGRIELGAHPESFRLERYETRIYVNVPNAGHIAVIDREHRGVTARWQVGSGGANFPMALDETGHRVFAGCRKPPRVLVFDTVTGRNVDRIACVGDTDDLFYDEARKRLYVSGGEGALDILGETADGSLRLLKRVQTASGARTSLFAPPFDRLFLAVPHRGSQRAEVREYVAE